MSGIFNFLSGRQALPPITIHTMEIPYHTLSRVFSPCPLHSNTTTYSWDPCFFLQSTSLLSFRLICLQAFMASPFGCLTIIANLKSLKLTSSSYYQTHSYQLVATPSLQLLRPIEGNGTPLQYFCLENPMDRGTW